MDVMTKLAEFKRVVMDNPPEVNLPQISEMQLMDVEAIREFTEWQAFRKSQGRMLEAGFSDILNAFDDYQGKLRGFQEKLGDWASSKNTKTCRRLSTGVSLVFQVGSEVLLASHGGGPHSKEIIRDIAIATTRAMVERNIQESVNGFCVKLLVKAHNHLTGLDKEHTFQLELMRKTGQIQRKEVEDMIREIQGSKDLLQLKPFGPAEQANS
jgi:hypothetical protein